MKFVEISILVVLKCKTNSVIYGADKLNNDKTRIALDIPLELYLDRNWRDPRVSSLLVDKRKLDIKAQFIPWK